jgi:hypothetical protein
VTRSKTMVMACSGRRFSFSSLSVCVFLGFSVLSSFPASSSSFWEKPPPLFVLLFASPVHFWVFLLVMFCSPPFSPFFQLPLPVLCYPPRPFLLFLPVWSSSLSPGFLFSFPFCFVLFLCPFSSVLLLLRCPQFLVSCAAPHFFPSVHGLSLAL